ncbi:hypothetical protein [Pseudomonas sp. S1(2024)]|uniref:hypothetical protein n=1 Tax=Pseudomonas sp. S1(2024) TaxID=3390191 RepID=UPI00397AA2B0
MTQPTDEVYQLDIRFDDPRRTRLLGFVAQPHECRARFELLIHYVAFTYARNPEAPQTAELKQYMDNFKGLLDNCPILQPALYHQALVNYLRSESGALSTRRRAFSEHEADAIVKTAFPAIMSLANVVGVSIDAAVHESMLTPYAARYEPRTPLSHAQSLQALINLMPVPCQKHLVLRLFTQGLLMEDDPKSFLGYELDDATLHKLYRVFGDQALLNQIREERILEDSLALDLGL